MGPPKKKSTSTIVTRSAAAAAASPAMDSEAVTSSASSTSDKGATGSSSPPPRPPPSTSPTKCAICLGDLVNSCYTNSCMHQFCFACLLQWSKVKPECPLCKSLFQSIYHNIRSNDDYDEYNVPSPTETIPSLSIHFAHHDAFAPTSYRAGASFRRLSHMHSLYTPPPPYPGGDFHDHGGYSFHRFMSRERARVDRMRDPSYIRILEMGPLSEPRAFDLMNMNTSSRPGLDNPFYSDEPEFFGSFSTGPARSSSSSTTRGYTRRRRIYDRGQYVQSFNASTIPPGTVFFPSVEYFRTHPSSYPRVSEWLHRELTVLLGLNFSRSEMASIYDTIFSVLFRYDIRSSEFREMIRAYLTDRTRHFQHEFYNFVLSGMRMEEYDNLCVYSSPSRSGAASTRGSETSAAVSHSDQPVLVTISDDDDDGANDIAEVDASYSVSARNRNSNRPSSSRASVIQNPEIVLSDEEGTQTQDRVVPGTSTGTAAQGIYEVPVGEVLESPSSPSLGSIQNYDWILPPAIVERDREELNNANNIRQRSIDADRARRLADIRSRVEGSWGSRNYPIPPPAHSSSSAASSSLEFLRPSRSGRPHGHHHASSSMSESRYLDGRRSGVHSSLSRSPGPSGSSFHSYREPGPREPLSLAVEFPWETPTQPRANRDSSLSCAPLSSGSRVGVRISQSSGSGTFPRIELSSDSGRRRPSPTRVNDNDSVETSAAPPPPVAPTTSFPAVVSDDSDEVELLGVHAIVKPPPLAVITLSSDDEDEGLDRGRLKTENVSGREQTTSQAPPSPDLVIDDEFLNWTMDRNSRPFDVFPLTDNDDVQPIMDFRPNPRQSMSTMQLSSPGSRRSPFSMLVDGLPSPPPPPKLCQKRKCKKKESSQGSKSKCRSRKSSRSKSKKRKSTRTVSTSSTSEFEAEQDYSVQVLVKRSKKRSKKRKSSEPGTSKTKSSREEKKMTVINRRIAQMESKNKKNEAGPGGEVKSRKRKCVFSSSPSSSSSSDSDSDSDKSSSLKKTLEAKSPVPGPSRSQASTSAASTSNSSSSNADLLDLRTAESPRPIRTTERRWESEGSDEDEEYVPFVHTRHFVTTNPGSNSSDSVSSGYEQNRSPDSYGLLIPSRNPRPSSAARSSYFAARHLDGVSVSSNVSSHDETLFAPETDSDTNPNEPSNLPRRSNIFSYSPEHSTAQDLSQPTVPEDVSSLGRGRSDSASSYPNFLEISDTSSNEDGNALLDLRVASGLGNLPDSDQEETPPNSSPAGGREREGYWSAAHDWI